MAIQFLSSLKDDESEYVRKSIGNALKDISKKYPELVSNELKQWDLSSKEIKQVHSRTTLFLAVCGIETVVFGITEVLYLKVRRCFE